jgi:hypothetical protein
MVDLIIDQQTAGVNEPSYFIFRKSFGDLIKTGAE